MAIANNEPAKTTRAKLETYFLYIILLIAFILVFMVFRPYISVLLMAFVLTVIFRPVFMWILRKTGHREILASVLTTLFIVLIILIPLAIFASLVVNELIRFLSSPSSNLLHLSTVHGPGFLQRFDFDLGSYLRGVLSSFTNNIGKIFSDLATVFIYLILTIISSIYFFKDGHKIKKSIFNILPFTPKQREKLGEDMSAGVRAVIGGYVLVAIIQGVVSGIGFWIFRIPNPALWGFITFIAALVPTFGTSLVNIPAVIYLFLNGQTGNSIGLLLWWAVAISIIDNYIGPKFISGRVRIHVLLLIFSIIGGLHMFGSIGFIVGPLILIFFWSVLEMFKDKEEELGIKAVE